MFGDRGRGDQIKRPRPEPVRRAGQGTYRADLNGVAGEVGLEGFLLVDADLLQGTALDEGDERITGDLFGEPSAACAEHAALTVQQDVGGDVDRLGVGALLVGEPAFGVAVRHRLVLQRALPALVADGAVEWMVDQQEFHVPALRLVGNRRGELSLDLHSRRNFEGAGGLRLGDGTPGASIGHLNEALPARADRVKQRMIAEPWHLDADELGGANDQGAFGHRYLDVIDRQGDQILAFFNGGFALLVGDNRHSETSRATPSASRDTCVRTPRNLMLLLLRARERRWCCARTGRAPKPGCAWRLRTRRGSTGWQR